MSQHFKFSPSFHLAVMLCMAHGAFLMVLPLLALPFWSRLMLAAVALFSLAYYLRRDAWLRAPYSCVELALEGSDAVLKLRNGVQLRGGIAHGSLVTPYLTMLNVSLPEWHRTRSVIILPDSMAKDSFRQLRVWLRWGGQGAL
jgi:toxin CptA